MWSAGNAAAALVRVRILAENSRRIPTLIEDQPNSCRLDRPSQGACYKLDFLMVLAPRGIVLTLAWFGQELLEPERIGSAAIWTSAARC
jgi:hypothetical protein